MLSDLFVPMPNFAETTDPLENYLEGLRVLEGAADGVDIVVPGHGSVATAGQIRARLDVDHTYVQALRDGREPEDSRFG